MTFRSSERWQSCGTTKRKLDAFLWSATLIANMPIEPAKSSLMENWGYAICVERNHSCVADDSHRLKAKTPVRCERRNHNRWGICDSRNNRDAGKRTTGQR